MNFVYLDCVRNSVNTTDHYYGLLIIIEHDFLCQSHYK